MASRLLISNSSPLFSIMYESEAGRQGDVEFAMRTSLKYSSALSLPSPAVALICGLSLGPSLGALVTTGEQMKGSAIQLCAVPGVTECQRHPNNILQMHEVPPAAGSGRRESTESMLGAHTTWKFSLGCAQVTAWLWQGRIWNTLCCILAYRPD